MDNESSAFLIVLLSTTRHIFIGSYVVYESVDSVIYRDRLCKMVCWQAKINAVKKWRGGGGG